MSDRLSFYIEHDSPIHRLNPLTKLVTVFTFILLSYLSPFDWMPTVIFLAVIIPLSFAAQIGRAFLRATGRLLLPVVGFLFVMQAFFHPAGEQVIFEIWVLNVTQESVWYAYRSATRILTMVSSFLLLLLTTHPSKLMSDLVQRGVPGALSYIITSTLQILPQMQQKARTIMDAQRSRGLETQGSLARRVRALLPLVGPLVFGSLVDVEERAVAIEARAFNSNRKKTSLFEIQDPTSERVWRWLMVVLVVVVIGLRIWL